VVGLLSIVIHIGLDDPNALPLVGMSVGSASLGAAITMINQYLLR
jgi:hypothetical protein